MAFFKTTRDQLKANTLVSHLEFAQQCFRPHDALRCEHHLKAAEKALAVVLQAKAEYILSDVGWQYVAQMASQLYSRLTGSGRTQSAKVAREIGHRALLIVSERGDPVSDADFDAQLESSDEPVPRIMRDPFRRPTEGEKVESVEEPMIESSGVYAVTEAVPLLKACLQRGGGALIKVGDEFRSLTYVPFLSNECTLTISSVQWPNKSLPPVPGSVIRKLQYGRTEHSAAIEDLLLGARADDCLSITVGIS